MPIKVTYKCEAENHLGMSILNNKKSFKCEVCDLPIVVDTVKLQLSAHGHTEKTLRHQLIQLTETGIEK